MSLDEFLKQEKNSVIREKLINYRIFYEIKLEAAKNNGNIDIYIPEIDKDGFDFILDDSNVLMPFQIKSKNKSSKTKIWEIQKNLIRPKPYNCTLLGYEMSPEGDGSQGGFILTVLNIENNDIQTIDYYYTDCFILDAFEKSILNFKNDTYNESCKRLISEFKSDQRSEKVKIKRSAMVRVNNIDKLLALSGVYSKSHNGWKEDYTNYLKNPGNTLKEEIIKSLKLIIDDEMLKWE